LNISVAQTIEHLKAALTKKLTAIKDFDFTGIDKIVDNIPVPVLKPELPPKNHFVIGKVSFKDSANNDIA